MDIIISDSCMFWHYPSISVVCAVTHFRSYRMFLRVLVLPPLAYAISYWPERSRDLRGIPSHQSPMSMMPTDSVLNSGPKVGLSTLLGEYLA